jgi:glutathione S-transferase
MLKLYYTPGACSLSPHITLREAGLAFELVRVDLRAKRTAGDADYRAVNPKGYVPALSLDDGNVLTEGVAIVQWIADQKPELTLAPPAGSLERVRLWEWLNFIATELHKGMAPLYAASANEEYKLALRERLAARFAVVAAAVEHGGWLMGETFTVADPYALYVIRSWEKFSQTGVLPALTAYKERIVARPSVKAALEAEGLL